MRRLAIGVAVGALVLVLVAQVVPDGRIPANPSIRREPAWDGPRTRELAARACFDCHSNQTAWPWYSAVAPASWLIRRDVAEGRRKLNFSEWDRVQKEAWESAKTVRKGEMPPWYYALPQSRARLSPPERLALAQGFEATFGVKRSRGGRGGGGPAETD